MWKVGLAFCLVIAACSTENEAVAFAESDAHVVPIDELPEDPGESYRLALHRIEEIGWSTRIKTPGNPDQPQNSEYAAAVDAQGPPIVWLPVHWDRLTDRTKARMAWHEYTHIKQQLELGRERMAQLLTQEPYWRVAAEIPATAQSLVVLGKYGQTEDELSAQVQDSVAKYPGRIDLSELDRPDEWYEMARGILEDRVHRISVHNQGDHASSKRKRIDRVPMHNEEKPENNQLVNGARTLTGSEHANPSPEISHEGPIDDFGLCSH